MMNNYTKFAKIHVWPIYGRGKIRASLSGMIIELPVISGKSWSCTQELAYQMQDHFDVLGEVCVKNDWYVLIDQNTEYSLAHNFFRLHRKAR